MNMKWITMGISTIVALSLSLPPAYASPLSELEKKQQETEQKKSELESGIQEKTNAITENKIELTDIMKKITELDTKINEIEFEIVGVQTQIDQTKVEIDELKKTIQELQDKIAERTELLKERARAIQLNGGSVDYIDVLLGANSFIDFVDRFSAVNTLMEADREIMLQQTEDKEALADQKATVEIKLTQQKKQEAELQTLKSSLAIKKNEQDGLVKELTAEQRRLAGAKSELENRFEEEIEISIELENQIMAEQERLAEVARKEEERQAAAEADRERQRQAEATAERERQRQAESDEKERQAIANEKEQVTLSTANRKTINVSKKSGDTSASEPVEKVEKLESSDQPSIASSSSSFIRPAAGRHTSGFGGRDIGDGAETHLGYDIANVTGTPIVAAASGSVSYAGVMGGYGNVVILTHSINGQTHATVYAHMNSINVSVGQSVSQGQQVGGMGNTGRSTGTHVHFEIHVGPWNGARSNAVNPAQYIN